jgi:hypothetical protein
MLRQRLVGRIGLAPALTLPISSTSGRISNTDPLFFLRKLIAAQLQLPSWLVHQALSFTPL